MNNAFRFLKNRTGLWLAVGLLCFCPVVVSQDNDSSGIQLNNGKAGGEQWNINCVDDIKTAKQWIVDQNKGDAPALDTPEFRALQRRLDVCAKLFNTPDNPAYRSCPNYEFFAMLLDNLKANKDRTWWQEKIAEPDFALRCLE